MPPPSSPKTWGPALVLTPITWVTGFLVLTVNQSVPFPRAAVIASFGALSGLLLFLAYRVASGRGDGLASFIFGGIVALNSREHGDLWWELSKCAFHLAILVPLLFVLGLYLRWKGRPNPGLTPEAQP